MKQMILMIAIIAAGTIAAHAQSTTPVYLNNGTPPGVSTYQEHGQQGNKMYQNNSQWYNKDNVTPSSPAPSGNGQYITPGNSNAVNTQMYNGNVTPSGTIYPSSGSDTYTGK